MIDVYKTQRPVIEEGMDLLFLLIRLCTLGMPGSVKIEFSTHNLNNNLPSTKRENRKESVSCE